MSFITKPEYQGGLPPGFLGAEGMSWLVVEQATLAPWFHLTVQQAEGEVTILSALIVSRLATLTSLQRAAPSAIQSVRLASNLVDGRWQMHPLEKVWRGIDQGTGTAVDAYQFTDGRIVSWFGDTRLEDLMDLELQADFSH